MVRTRFAPSPTGFVHVGSLRAALFPYLFAKQQGGIFLLRIEDTDQERLVPGAIENILRTLAWAGIVPDEGPVLNNGSFSQKGSHGPYIQSERLEIYKKHVQTLLDRGAAYYAFDTNEELEAMRHRQEAMKQSPKYEREKMKNQFTLSKEETSRLLANNTPSVIRLKVPEKGKVTFHDLIRGDIEVNTVEIDDQVLLKSDGFPTYHLAVVVDDYLMEITHVIRGEDWLPSTPKHVLLYQAFGWAVPQFAHMPLLVNKDRQKLSKRKGDVSVESFRDRGYLPEAFVNFLAFLGWNPGDDREIMSMAELIESFSLEKVQRAAAVFNEEKLDWYNGQYIRSIDTDQLVEKAVPFFVNAGLISYEHKNNSKVLQWLVQVILLVKERLVRLGDLPELTQFVFVDPVDYDAKILVWKKSTPEKTKEILTELASYLETIPETDWSAQNLTVKVGEWIQEKNYSNGDVLWPMRVALSGKEHSPGPFEIAVVIGKKRVLERLMTGIKKLV